MARSRNIKPGFFSNEILAELEAFDRLLFIGLWCLADREGRLEDRPKRIKMELFPCDLYDVNAGLESLKNAGFVNRYSVENFHIIEILNFGKHQNPHGSEKDSVLPDENGFLTVNERNRNVVVAGKSTKVHVNSTLVNVNPPLENALIPDSFNLIPEDKPPCHQQADDGAKKRDPVPYQKIIDLYNKTCGHILPQCIKANEARKRNIRKCWNMEIAGSKPFQRGEFWEAYFNDCLSNPHWCGQNDRAWKADIEFVTRETSVLKLLESQQ